MSRRVGIRSVSSLSGKVTLKGFLYAGTEDSPGKVLKASLSDFSRVGSLELAAGENNLWSLAIDATYLYAICSVTPSRVVHIRLSTFAKVDAITFAAGENAAQDCVIVGNFLYIALNVNPAKIVKVNLSTFTQAATLTLPTGEGWGITLDSDGTYLYIGLATTPARIIKVDLSTFTRRTGLTLDANDYWIYWAPASVIVGNYLYVGVWNGVERIVKINLSTTEETADFTTYTEVDPNNKLSQTSARASWTDMIRNEACYLYKARVIPPEFTHKFDFQVSSIDVNADASDNIIAYIWVVCETSGRPAYVDVGKNINLSVLEDGSSTTQFQLYLSHKDDMVQDTSINLAVGTTYYLTITKSGAVVTCTIYSDAARTVVVDTLTIDLTGEDEENMSFSYVETTASFDSAGDGSDQSDGFVENLIFQAEMSRDSALDLDPNNEFPDALASDNGNLYVGTEGAGTNKLLKINLSTFTKVADTKDWAGFQSGMGVVLSEGYLYLGTYSSPATIYKYDPANLSLDDTLTFQAGELQIQYMIYSEVG